jgi:hypothetical protein
MTNNVAPRFNGYENNHRNGVRASDDIWNHSDQRSDSRRLRVSVPAEWAGTKRAITRYDWNQSLTLSRQLSARLGEFQGAICQKSTYVIGDSWCPRFLGKNQAWGRDVEDYLEYWFEVANLRGEPFDFVTSLFVDSIAQDRDGDAAMATVMDGKEPRVQFIPAHRIAFRNSISQDSSGYLTVPSGRFEGAKAYNGVIFDKKGRVVGYNVLGESKDDDRQFSVAEMQLLYEPQWSDQGRGIPAAATALLSWMDYEDIHHFLKRQVKMDSAQGIMHYNEEGAAEDSRDFIDGKASGAENQDVLVEKLEGNEILYFKSNGGGKLEAYRSDRPHPNVDNYTMRILRGCLLAMGWFYELYDPSKVGGASTRMIQDMARASVRRRQRNMRKRFLRAIVHAITVGMDNRDIPRNEDPDWMRWEPTLPSKLTVDARYDDKTKMERIRMGAGTYANLYGDEGNWWEDEMVQRIKEQKFIQEECKRQGVDIEKVQILTPNGNPQQSGDGDKDTSEDKTNVD